MIKSFLNTLTFLTILPLGRKDRLEPEEFGRFPGFYPLAGLTIGLVSALIWLIASLVFPRPIILSILVVTITIILSRGFHLDGLADAADALLSHKSTEEKLRIMKDSHQGTFGVLSIVLDIMLKTALVFSLSETSPATVLILYPMWGRLTTSVVATGSTYIRTEGGLGQWMVNHSGQKELWTALISTLLISALFGPLPFLTALASALMGLVLIYVWRLVLGGITGDLLGASVEIGEIWSLFFFLALL